MFKWFMLLIYILLCGYVLWHLLYSLSLMTGRHRKAGTALSVVFILMALSIFGRGFLPESTALPYILKFGTYWLGILIYFIFFFLAADICMLLRKLIRHRKGKEKNKLYTRKEGYILTGIVIVCSVAFVIYGMIHMRTIVLEDYEITVNKDGGNIKDLNVILIADLHMGYSVGCKEMEKMVECINAESPDLVVLAGDIFDNDYDALDDPERLAGILRSIESRMGVYAVFGNHDVEETLVGGFSVSPAADAIRDERMAQFMADSGIITLEDDTLLLEDSVYLTGRLDGEKNGYGSAERESIKGLTEALDEEKPLLMISHEPDRLSEYAECGVDVLFSGHTHAGQFFPLTIVQPLVWENYWGMKKVDAMYSIVTSGVGVYGPPLRVFTNSEVVRLNVHFKG